MLKSSDERYDPQANAKANERKDGHSQTTPVAAEEILPPPKLEKEAEFDAAAPPEGGYGWVVVIASFLINALTWGINSTYGVYLAHYLKTNAFPGASSIEYGFVGGISVSVGLLVAPLATACTRKFGTRTTLLVGVGFETVALIAASFAKQIWQLFLSQGVCFAIGLGFLFVGSVGVGPQWFLKKRSLAMGMAAAGSGFGGLVFSLGTNAMIQNISLAWAFRITAICVVIVNTICALLMRDRNKHVIPEQKPFDHRLLKRYEVWLLLFWGILSMLGYVGLVFVVPNYAASVGLSAKQGSIVGACLNLGMACGRPVVGLTSDKLGRMNVAGSLTFFTGLISLVFWIFAKTFGVLIFYALLCGSVCGTFWATVAPVAAEVVGLKLLPSMLSIIWLTLVVPALFSTAIQLKLRRPSMGKSEYLHAQIFVGCMYIAASMCVFLLRKWKIQENERVEKEAAAEASQCSSPDSEKSVRERDARDLSAESARVQPRRRLFQIARV